MKRHCLLASLMLFALAPARATDPRLWLEDVEGPKAIEWVKARNEKSLKELGGDPRYEPLRRDMRSILNAQDRIPRPVWQGGLVYNFWQDADHIRGFWRRASLDEYRKAEPKWEMLLDIDRLGREEGKSWVWKGANCLYPEYERCMVSLSPGGKDADVQREFNVAAGTFVPGGFTLAEAKQDAAWVDRDTLLVGTDFGPGSMTDSGYPRTLRLWKRAAPLADSPTVFSGSTTDVGVTPWVAVRDEGRLIIIQRLVSYFEHELHRLGDDGKVRRLALPLDVRLHDWYRGRVLVKLTKDWKVGSKIFASGSLVAVPDDAYDAAALDGRVELVYAPAARANLGVALVTREAVYLQTLENVVGRIYRADLDSGTWRLTPVPMPSDGAISLQDSDPARDELFVHYQSFLVPPSLYLLARPGAAPERIKSLPERFNAAGFEVVQREARSADGTMVPYFLVRKRGLNEDGSAPTLLWAYGGFERAYAPSYLETLGKGWLEKGGSYVLATIRGGGEFGPAWHQAALKTHRQRAFDDFIAVAEDLVARKSTSPRRLGIMGGSNGGLLVGVALTQRPELYRAVVCQVPLLDMLRYNKLLAGASWMGEYGDPEGSEREAILKYSPYQNVRTGVAYPRPFFITSTKDDRVHPGHARKMVARMEEVGADPLYFENIEGGHGAAADLEQSAKRKALEFTYLYRRLID